MSDFTQSDMLYDDGVYYKWTAKADADNPYYKKGDEWHKLNRTEGYEVLYFINHLGTKLWEETPNIATYQKVERMIRHKVPAKLKGHLEIENWIVDNWLLCN